MYMMQDLTDLWNHVMYMVLCAPDEFPFDDFLKDEDQMTMKLGFKQLREGIFVAYPSDKYCSENYDELRAHLNSMLDQARESYDRGDIVKGAHLLQDFRNEIFVKKGKVRKLN